MSEGKLFHIKHKSYDCRHPAVELDMDSRTVRCTQCQRVIDPFDFLFNCSVEEDSLLARFTRLRQEEYKLKTEIERLKKYKVLLTTNNKPKP